MATDSSEMVQVALLSVEKIHLPVQPETTLQEAATYQKIS